MRQSGSNSLVPDFAGLVGDTSSELYDALEREYEPTQGRWISPDPAGLAAVDLSNPQSLNRYAYVMNNPTTLIDPLGLDSCKPGTPNCKQPPPCYGMVCADNPATYGGLPYPGYQNIGAPNLFDLQLFTACNSEGCSTGLDFNGATVANGILLAQGPSSGTPPATKPANNGKPCPTGFGFGVAGGGNGDAAVAAAGTSVTGTLGGGLFYNSSTGLSAGGFTSGGAVAFAGSNVAGAPAQTRQDVSGLGLFGGVGGSLFFTNAGSVQQLSGPFSTLNFNVGYSFAQLQVSYAKSGNIWYLQISPPLAGLGAGASVTTMKTTTATTKTGCH